MKNIIQKISGGWIFLIIVFSIYGTMALFMPHLVFQSLLNFVTLLKQILPALGFIFIMIFLFEIFLKPQMVTKYLSEKAGVKGWIIAIVGGIISMGAIYMWYPLLADLKEKGMSNGLIATFLYNRAIKIPLLPFFIYYFGWLFTIVLTIYMIIFSVINGLLVEKIVNLNNNK